MECKNEDAIRCGFWMGATIVPNGLYLYELLASGRIKGRKLLGRWLISTTSIEAYRRERS